MPYDPFRAHDFDPETLRVLFRAFDGAWKDVKRLSDFRNEAYVREVLALAVLDLARSGERDLDRLRTYAVNHGQAVLGSAKRAS